MTMVWTIFLRVARGVIPPSRERVTVRRALPLLLFAAVIGGACVAADLLDVLMFSNRGAFAVLLALPWVWWIHVTGRSGLRGGRALAALLVRLLLLTVFAVLLSEPRAVRRSRRLSTVYALDVSDSVGPAATDEALTFVVKTASEKPEGDEAGLVVFGREAGVELPPRQTFPFEAINSRIGRDGTDLGASLGLAAAVLPEANDGQIVLISDGVSTDGDLSGALDEISSRGISVDVLPIQYDFGDEVWLEKLEVPRVVKLGETYEASIVLSSLTSGRGRLVLRENGKLIGEEMVDYQPGKNRYALPLYLREPGYYEYVARIEVPEARDGWRQNNIAMNYVYLRGEGRVLLVTDPEGDPREWEAFAGALRTSKRICDSQVAYEFPRDPMSLMPYDCVVFANVPADAFDVVQLGALKQAVHDQGTGFLMIGGRNSFGPGGYHRSPIEEVLPVTMDISQKKVLPKGALALILHTCEFPEGNTWGKRVAKEAIRVLGDQDEVGALVYDYQGGEKWLFPLTPAAEYDDLVKLINNAAIGDMPSFSATMQLGLDALKESDAAAKHMIIISDGDPSPPPPAMVQEFVASAISVSMVAVFPHGGQDISIMRSIAATTGGRYYFPQDPSLLPSIFIKEAKKLKRNLIQNKTFVPVVEYPSPILKGMTGLPELKGYVLTTPKPRAVTILKGPEEEEVDPVLSVWRYGLGKTAAFTSDLSPNWASSWVEWDRYSAFVEQLVTDISRTELRSDLYLSTYASGRTGIVQIEDHGAGSSYVELRVQVNGPRGKSVSVEAGQTGPRRYQGVFDLWGQGRYRVMVAGVRRDATERIVGGFVVPYSPEYLRFRSNPIVLSQIAERTGGRILTGAESGTEIFREDRESRTTSRAVFDWFLILLACLIPLDVAARRVQLDWGAVREWFGARRSSGESGETFSALLRRKDSIAFDRGESSEARVPPVSPGVEKRAIGTPGTRKPSSTQPKEAAPPAPADAVSTTQRLLARKKKWKDDSE